MISNITKNDIIINLCDMKFNDILKRLKDGQLELKKMDIKQTYHVQVGSYICGNYFIKLLKTNILDELKEKYIFDIVIPILSETQLEDLLKFNIDNILRNAYTLVINDFGMLSVFNTKYNIRVGRMFMKEFRDHRYLEFNNNKYFSKINEVISFINNNGYKINGIDCDIISNNFFIPNIDKEIKIYCHYPYRYITSGHICEYASINKNIKNKFRPDDICNCECFDYFSIYNDKQFNNKYYKIGRAVYDIIDSNIDIAYDGELNMIYSPEVVVL